MPTSGLDLKILGNVEYSEEGSRPNDSTEGPTGPRLKSRQRRRVLAAAVSGAARGAPPRRGCREPAGRGTASAGLPVTLCRSLQFEFECRARGADILAYPPVVAGGSRANTLHYVKNNQLIKVPGPGEASAGRKGFVASRVLLPTLPHLTLTLAPGGRLRY